MPEHVFSNPPLAEIVFEVKFKDPNVVNYELLIGELYSRLKPNYPFNEMLKPREMPALLFPFIIQQRFRASQNSYPLYQLGPGIMSFNINGATYHQSPANKWESFKTKLLEFLRIYNDVLADKFFTENFDHFSLRFINKVEDTAMYPDIKNYFTNKLKLKIDLVFGRGLPYITNLENVALAQTYYLNQEKTSKFQFNIGTITEGSRKLLLDTAVISNNVPQFEGIEGWLEEAHSTITTFFFKLTQNITAIH